MATGISGAWVSSYVWKIFSNSSKEKECARLAISPLWAFYRKIMKTCHDHFVCRIQDHYLLRSRFTFTGDIISGSGWHLVAACWQFYSWSTFELTSIWDRVFDWGLTLFPSAIHPPSTIHQMITALQTTQNHFKTSVVFLCLWTVRVKAFKAITFQATISLMHHWRIQVMWLWPSGNSNVAALM